MSGKLLINAVDAEEYRVAILKDGLLDGFYIETSTAEQKTGNIYKGIIERVEPNLQACFVNYGGDKNGFLPGNEIHPEYFLIPHDRGRDQAPAHIEKVVKKGQELLVQVTKEMTGRKGAQLTTYISLASRFLVLMPGGNRGVSRKIEDEEERGRLKEIMAQLNVTEDVGYIVRTAAMKQTKREISRDFNRVLRLWNSIRKQVLKAPQLSLIHKEQDVCLRTLRDYYTNEITEIVVDDKDTMEKVLDYMKIISPRNVDQVKLHEGKSPIFAHSGVEDQIQGIYSNRVPLKSGGSIVIDTTEALIAIDVNSGRTRGGKDVETMVYRTNLEAAEEIARQVRLRDLGGLIVVDFIDMRDKNHNREVEKVLKEKTKEDRAKVDFSHISKFGILEFSRERLRPSLESRSYQTCQTCMGRGLVPSVESAALAFFRQIWMGISHKQVRRVQARLPLEVGSYLLNKKRREIGDLESRHDVEILILADPAIPLGGGTVEFQGEEGP